MSQEVASAEEQAKRHQNLADEAYSILGLHRDNGKENGNYYNGLYIRVIFGVILGVHWGYIGGMWGVYWDDGT